MDLWMGNHMRSIGVDIFHGCPQSVVIREGVLRHVTTGGANEERRQRRRRRLCCVALVTSDEIQAFVYRTLMVGQRENIANELQPFG